MSNKKDQIIACAVKVFAENGYERARVIDIVKAASISKGTFYQYFRDKKDLFTRCAERLLKSFYEEIYVISTVECSTKKEVEENITQICQRVLEICKYNKSIASIFFKEALHIDEDFKNMYDQFFKQVYDLISERLQNGINRGLVVDLNPGILSWTLIGMVERMAYKLVLEDSEFEVEELVQVIVSFMLNGFLR